MDREQKAAAIEELTTQLNEASAVLAVDYRGMSVPQAAELRTELRQADTAFKIVKNRLTLLAADAAGAEGIKDHLTGPTALALVHGDVAAAAKTISKLGGEWELLSYKGGLMDGAVLSEDDFKAIAKLPGRDQLNAQFAGIVASPITGLVRGLGSMVQGLALQLGQIAEQGLVSGEAPPAEEETPAEEAPAEEAPEETPAEDEPAAEASDDGPDPDPAPEESPEETTEEQAPDEGGDVDPVEKTEEGDADVAEEPSDASDESGDAGDDAGGEEPSEDSDGDTPDENDSGDTPEADDKEDGE